MAEIVQSREESLPNSTRYNLNRVRTEKRVNNVSGMPQTKPKLQQHHHESPLFVKQP